MAAKQGMRSWACAQVNDQGRPPLTLVAPSGSTANIVTTASVPAPPSFAAPPDLK